MQNNMQGRQATQDPLVDAAGQAGQEAMKVAEQAKDQGFSWLNKQKGQASEMMGATQKAVEEVGQKLRQEGHGTMADFAEMAAQQVDRFSQNFGQRDVEDLFMDLERMARRQPAYFLGGALALGFLAARFMKSSAQSREMRPMHDSGSRNESWGPEGHMRSNPSWGSDNERTGSFETPGSWSGRSGSEQTRRSEPMSASEWGDDEGTPPSERRRDVDTPIANGSRNRTASE